VAKYSVQPGSKLNEFINSGNESNEYYEFKLKQEYNYPVDVLVALTSK
jgi:maltoporin